MKLRSKVIGAQRHERSINCFVTDNEPQKRITASSHAIAKRLALLPVVFLSAAIPLQCHSTELDDMSMPQQGERLSEWILHQPNYQTRYLLGLQWQTPSQRNAQSALKHHLLALLAGAPGMEKTDPEARRQLSNWLTQQPITGRMPLPSAEPYWLKAHPDRDPILTTGDKVKLPPYPVTVTVITDDGQICSTPHQAGVEALGYVSTCASSKVDQIDRLWIVQPDGKSQGVSVAAWNREQQDEPAPGAIIWAPGRSAGWTKNFSALFAQFLATQELDSKSNVITPNQFPKTTLPPSSEWQVDLGARARSLAVTANDWGLAGLLQTPTARMSETGELRFHMSHVLPYTRGTIMFQPLSWLETGFRYTDIGNRLYGPDIAGGQSYKDKSLDFKVRLAEETVTRPQLALGMIDIGGTGLFSSEYLVASKRTGNLDWSLGLAWGYLGHRGEIDNPLSFFGKGYNKRATGDVGVGGTVSSNTFFTGKPAVFGGVQYHLPDSKLLLKLEYDGNNYKNEPLNSTQKQSSPINVGVVYRHSSVIDFTAGIERGRALMLGFTLHDGLDRISMPKVLDDPMPAVRMRAPENSPDWTQTAADLARQTQWNVREISVSSGEIRVIFEEVYGAYWKERIERASAVLHRDAPGDIKRFVFTLMEHGVAMSDRIVLRDAWVAEHERFQAITERFEAIAASEPRIPRLQQQPTWREGGQRFKTSWTPNFRQNIGGPDNFILADLGISTPTELRLSERTWASGTLYFRLVDNYQNFKYDAPSEMPRVRTNIRSYLTASRLNMPNLQVTHIGQVTKDQYFSIYGGYLEWMYAGIGGEWLYRPWHSPVAVGVDVNHVQKRAFDQGLGLLDYKVNTGHATLYWDTGWKSTHVNLSAGQYLAGDKGITVDVSRTFNNGVTLGAWATRTNVSAATFGEGSFDKGIYVSIPFDAMLPFSSPTTGRFNWAPLTRDGGARLSRTNKLYDLTKARDPNQNRFAPAGPRNGDIDQDGPEWLQEKSIWSDLGDSTHTFGEQVVQGHPGETLLKGGAWVLASSLFDKPADKWARKHQGGAWDTAASMANGIPFALGIGAGLLWWSASGSDIAAETAWTSIKSAGLTLGIETLTKFAVGRSRPEADLGTHHFSSFGKGAANSSFPSIHMGVSYSLVTPFAQRYDAPWLYAVAGATAFGRIQQRQHFVSDTVAGSLLGYGIGSLMLDQQRNAKGPRIGITDNGVWAQWPIN